MCRKKVNDTLQPLRALFSIKYLLFLSEFGSCASHPLCSRGVLGENLGLVCVLNITSCFILFRLGLVCMDLSWGTQTSWPYRAQSFSCSNTSLDILLGILFWKFTFILSQSLHPKTPKEVVPGKLCLLKTKNGREETILRGREFLHCLFTSKKHRLCFFGL